MIPHLPILRQINAAGFLTTESQAGRKYRGINPNTSETYETWERAYLCGFIQAHTGTTQLRSINSHTDKIAQFVPVLVRGKRQHWDPKWDFPLTMTFVQKDHTWSQPVVNTHQSWVRPLTSLQHDMDQLGLSWSDDLVYVQMVDPVWNRSAVEPNGLFTQVLAHLQDRGETYTPSTTTHKQSKTRG